MTPAARIAAAATLLDQIMGEGAQADRLLAAWGRSNRYAGSGDRAAIADLVYDRLRRWRSCCWRGGVETGRGALLGGLLLDETPVAEIDRLFSGEGYGPAALSDAEREQLPAASPAPAPPETLDYPDWLSDELDRSLGLQLAEIMTALRQRAPLDLRVNLLRTSVDEALRGLADAGVSAAPGPLSPTCLRVSSGDRRLRGSPPYRDGWVEPQDAASQAVVDLTGAAPGDTVLDFCAGGGGKTLALAASMQGQGLLVAHDVDPGRMIDLPARAERAGVVIETRETAQLADLEGRCDIVLVDAPCSGAGAWRRQPEAKWRLTRQRLDALLAAQVEALDAAAIYVRPGGKLVYVTCSFLECENRLQAEGFANRCPAFMQIQPVFSTLPGDAGDGFFAAVFARGSEAS